MLNKLFYLIEKHNGINDKSKLSGIVQDNFNCVKDRSVFYTNEFAIRFCKSETRNLSNTVLSLSALQKYDNKPFIVCIVTPSENYCLLANTTFLTKISHSSQALRADNIKGSFNGGDIIRSIDDIENEPKNFDILFAMHQTVSFEENLIRLVEKTTGIIPTGKKFAPNASELEIIYNAPLRAINFTCSADYKDLLGDLNRKVDKFQNEILISALIENTKLRGEIIEYLISGDDEHIKTALITSLQNKNQIPRFTNRHGIGDYHKTYENYITETDIKTKILIWVSSAPKGYNIDKILQFLAEEKSVFMLYFVGIDYQVKTIRTKLISMFQTTLVDNTVIQPHWASRNSRGISQFNGEAIKKIILNEQNVIDKDSAVRLIEKLLNL